MSQITPAELALLRTRPHQTEPKLVIYKPSTVFACRVNDTDILKSAISVPYDSVSSGAYTAIKDGMTMYVGTVAGKADLGRVRVKSASSTVLSVAENGLDWADNVYLTVVDFFELWPKSSLDVQNGTNIIHYIDYDIAYTSQNEYMGTLLCVGPPCVCQAGESIHWLSTGSIQTEGMDIVYDWGFGGGSPISGSSSDPGLIQYNTPGYYTTQVAALVTGTNLIDVTYRHVIVLGGSVQPYTLWGFDSIDGSRDEGGWAAKLWLREEILPEVMDGSLCIIYQDNWYGSTKQSIGGNAPNRQNILFVGYIVDNSISYNFRDGKMEFTVSSPTGRMKLLEGLSTSMDNVKTAPVAWQQVKNLTGKKALYYYLRWHTTVLNCVDVHWMIDPDPEVPSWDSEISSIYDIAQKFSDVYYLGEVVSDRHGGIWVEKHPKSVHAVTGSFRTAIDLDRQDWVGDIDITEQLSNPISYLEMHGLGYAGVATGTVSDYLSAAPYVNKRNPFGRADFIQGYVVSSQEENNQIVGDVFAYENARFPTVDIGLAGWYSLFDIAPEECVNLSTVREDTPRGIVWSRKPFIVREMSLEWDAKSRVLLPTISLHEATQGTAGGTVPIPTPVEPPTYPNFPPITGGWGDLPWPFDWPKPWVEPPPGEDDCRGNIDAVWNGPYGLAFSASSILPGESALAQFDCYVRGLARNPTEIRLDGITHGGTAWADILVQAVDGGQNVVATATCIEDHAYPESHTYGIYRFDLPGGMEVAGFKITAAGSSTGGACRISSGVITSGSVSATSDAGVPIAGLVPGNLYCITQVGQFYQLAGHPEWWSTLFAISLDGVWTADGRWGSNGQSGGVWVGGGVGGDILQVDRVGSTWDAYVYFIAHASNGFRVGDGVRADNGGSLGYAVYKANLGPAIDLLQATVSNVCL